MVLYLLMVFAAVVQAAPAGKVTNLEGRADLTAPGQPAKVLFIGDAVNVGDILRTKSASKLEVTWIDGSIARLSENSRLKVTEFSMGAKKRSTILSLFRGKVQNIVTGTTKLFGAKGGSKYEVHTPTSVCGVRGTTFFTYHENGISGALFTEGQGFMYSKGQPDNVKPVAPGVLMTVTSANKPPEAKPAKPGDANKLFNATNPSEKKKDDKKDEGKKEGGTGGGTSKSDSGTAAATGKDESTGGTKTEDTGSTTTTTTTTETTGTTDTTMLGGDPTATLGTAPPGTLAAQIESGTTADTPGTSSPLTNPTTPVAPVVVPVIEPTPTDTFTTLEQSVVLGDLTGILTGSISNTTNTGTLDFTGTGTASIYTLPNTGTLSDGSTYDAYLAGIPGSWRGLFTGLSNKGGVLSFLKSDNLDGTYIPPNGDAGSVSASGSLVRQATGYTSTGSFGPLAGIYLPFVYGVDVGNIFYTSFYPDAVSGYITPAGDLVGIWGLTTTGGIYYNNEPLQIWPTKIGAFEYYYAFLGDAQVTDDLQGHLSIAGENLNYMDQSYLGSFGLQYRATYSGHSYDAIGTGTYNLAPLKYSGYWGAMGTLYTNADGLMEIYGWDSGLIGGLTQTPWTGTTDFKAIGSYTASGGATYALWNTQLGGSDTASRTGYFEGTTAGIWGSAIPGSIRAIYVTPPVNGISTAGILTSDNIAVSPYPDISMWQASGNLGPYSDLTYTGDPTHWGITNINTSNALKLAGSFTASTGSVITGNSYYFYTTLLHDSQASTCSAWGIYNLKLTGTNTFSGKPSGDPVWSANLGAAGQFGYGSPASNGYWLASIPNGLWTDDGQITGSMSGSYLTTRYKGTLVSSPFYGVNSGTGGTWIGESIGIYEGTPLSFSGNVNPSIRYYYGTFSDDGSLSGLVGSVDPLWETTSAESAAITLMGKYSSGYASPYYIFNDETYSNNALTSQKTTYDSPPGSFFAVYGGIIRNSSVESLMAGLYIDPSGNAGFLKGDLSGVTYTGINMWEATGSLYQTDQMQASIGIAPENLYDQLWQSTDFGGKIAITNTLQGSLGYNANYYNTVHSIYNGTTSYPWGIWQASAAGDYETVSAPWTAKAGGSGSFGAYNSGGSLSDDSGYWIADINGSQWSDNKLAGTVSGKFLTKNKMGNAGLVSETGINGDMLGTYSAGMWQAVAMGTWRGTPLAFSGSVDWGSSGSFDVNSHTMVYDDPRATYQGYTQGIIGSTDHFIDDTATLSGIGTYAVNTNPMFAMDISKNRDSAFVNTDTIRLWFGGTKNSTQFAGKMMGLYANWNSVNKNYDVGYLTSGSALDEPVPGEPVTGNLYSGIGMWELTSGALTSSSKGNLVTQDDVTPQITETDTPRIGSIAGTKGITGTSNSYDMYFTDADGTWGVWRSETGGTYTSDPTSGWTGVDGTVEMVNNAIQSYSISHLTGTAWADGQLAATSSGRFLSLEGTGTSSGDILGVYDSAAKTWQALGIGQTEQTETLAFSSLLTGNLYQVVPGTVYNKEYQRPYGETSPYNSYFDPLRYETVYFKYGDPETYNPTTTIGFEWAEREGAGDTYKDEYHYYPSGKWVKITKGQGITHTAGSGDTSGDLVFDPPNQYTNFNATIVSGTTPFVSYNNYVASFSTAWNTNALIQNGAFTGILGGLNKYSLWISNSDPECKTNLILMGSHDAYNGSQIFGTSMSYDGSGTNNGAFYGALAGIIQDTDPAAAYRENPLTGLAIGLYVDPSGNAGVLKGNFTGKSYTGINMWESNDETGAATLYKYSTKFIATEQQKMSVSDVAEANIFTGDIGPGINSAVYGTFGGSGLIRSPFGLMGRTYSIASQPDWGVFTMQVGLANTYENPSAATSWSATLFGSAMFGKYDASYGTYADLGYWYTDLTSDTWTGGKMTGTMNGEFLTLLKKGTIEGSLLGTYDGTTSGIWQATAAGTYGKTQDVSFSSEIWGDSHALASGKTGHVEGDGYGYRFYYNPEGDNRYGSSEYGYYDSSAQTNKKVIRRFDIQGPPEAELPHQDTWVQDIKNIEDPSDDTYTFSTIVYQNEDGSPDYAAYYADMALLEKNPKTGGSVTAYDSLQFHNYNFNGIMAGVDNLWTNIANNAATTISLMGDIETESATPKLFTGTVVSCNPLVTTDPYNDSTSPINGAYFAYLGGAFGTNTVASDTLDGLTSGLYLAQDGSAGVLYGTISGDNDMNLGFWNASGSIKGYKLLSSTNTVTAGTFASLLNTTPPSQLHWIGNYLSADGALGGNTNITMAYFESTTTALDFSYYPAYWKESISPYGGFGTVKLLAGGTYVDPLSSYKVDFTFDTHNNQGLQSTIYFSTVWDTTITNNVYNGSVLHDGSFDPAKATGLVSVTVDHQQGGTLITGADIKGLFDPAAHTWQAVANGTAIETTAFVNLVNSFRTDAEKNAFMAALKIPAINVGAVNFTGGSGSGPNGSLSGVYMNNVGFYAYSTGQAPRIFASNEVGGNYTGVPVNTTVNWYGVSGTNMSNVSASLTTTAWNGSTWGATVTGSGTMASPSTGIVFKGGAAGSITPNPATPGTGVFGGSAAGIVGTAPAR